MDYLQKKIDDVIKISGQRNKKNTTAFINQNILPPVCALLNTDGGTIYVTDIQLDARKIEQAIMPIIGATAISTCVKILEEGGKDAPKTVIKVKKCSQFITLNYNLYVPTQKQIIAVAGDDRHNIRSMLQQSIVENCVVKGSHKVHFVKGKSSELNESDAVQLKHLKSESSSSAKITFAKRMVNEKNKFSSYVSGFANHRGGHIYYGIDDGTLDVIGEKLTEEDLKAVESAVTKAITKLVWTERKISPKRGVDWEIYFPKVENEKGEVVESTYVVVVFVAFCRGGVFTAEPVSYYLEDGNVKKMDFDTWWKSFIYGAFSKYFIIKPKEMDPVNWSTERNKKLFIELSEMLVDHRDAGDFDGFEKLCRLAESEQCKEKNSNLAIVSKAGRVTIAYKSGDAEKAQTLLQEYEKLVNDSQLDQLIFKVRLYLSQSLVARSLENYEESYEKGKEGLQLGQNIPAGLCLLWLYLECAMNAVCLAFQNKHVVERFGDLRKEALVYLEEAGRVATALTEDHIQYRIYDFQNKLCIYKAFVLLNFTLTGEAAEIAPTQQDLDAANAELSTVFKNQLNGNDLTKFREIEYHLAKSDYSTRLSEIKENKMEKKKFLKNAMDEASTAEKLAKKITETSNPIPKPDSNPISDLNPGSNPKPKSFKKLLEYAIKRVNVLKERGELCNDEPAVQIPRNFDGLRY